MKKAVIFILCFLVLASCSIQDVAPENTDNNVNTTITSDALTPEPVVEQESALEKKSDVSAPSTSPVLEDNNSQAASQTVSITVLGLDGMLVYSAKSEYRDGLSVFDLLMESSREKNIPAVYTGGKSSPYITSIGGFAEKQHGSSSGWIYTVNGESIMKPCNKCILNPHDSVEWKYITEFTIE